MSQFVHSEELGRRDLYKENTPTRLSASFLDARLRWHDRPIGKTHQDVDRAGSLVFSSPLRGEDTGEGEGRTYPLSGSLPRGEREPDTEALWLPTPYLAGALL